eukprot:scaffold2389_cov262-Pinguiococcus_pyrenoidosus.AAC.5
MPKKDLRRKLAKDFTFPVIDAKPVNTKLMAFFAWRKTTQEGTRYERVGASTALVSVVDGTWTVLPLVAYAAFTKSCTTTSPVQRSIGGRGSLAFDPGLAECSPGAQRWTGTTAKAAPAEQWTAAETTRLPRNSTSSRPAMAPARTEHVRGLLAHEMIRVARLLPSKGTSSHYRSDAVQYLGKSTGDRGEDARPQLRGT